MRAAFGLAGLLVAVGIVVVIIANNHPADTVQKMEPVKRQVERIAGVDEHGTKVSESIRLAPLPPNGKLKSMLVERLSPDGPMAKHFGLRENDVIIKAGPMDMKDQDEEMATALILDARGKDWKLTVIRDEQTIELPGGNFPGQAPAKQQNSNPVRRQLDAIPGISR